MSSLNRWFVVSTLSAAALAFSACSSLTRNEQAAAIGAVVGGVAGSAVTGGSTAGTVGGAVVGGVVGSKIEKKK